MPRGIRKAARLYNLFTFQNVFEKLNHETREELKSGCQSRVIYQKAMWDKKEE